MKFINWIIMFVLFLVYKVFESTLSEFFSLYHLILV